MNLNLTDEYKTAISDMARELNMSQSNVVRAAIRQYQQVHQRAMQGQRLAYVDEKGGLVPPDSMKAPVSDSPPPDPNCPVCHGSGQPYPGSPRCGHCD